MDPPASSSKPSFKLYQIRFTFSDVRLWTRIDKILRDSTDGFPSRSSDGKAKKGWSDFLPWRLYSYEDVCLVCAGLWLKGEAESGGVRLEGDDNALLQSRPDPDGAKDVSDSRSSRTQHRSSTQLIPPRPGKTARTPSTTSSSSSDSSTSNSSFDSARQRRYFQYPTNVRTTLMLLDVFHSQSTFWLDTLQDLLLLQAIRLQASGSPKALKKAIVLTPQNLTAMRLSSLSETDSRFVEWLAQARFGRKISVKRGWRDLVTAAVGW